MDAITASLADAAAQIVELAPQIVAALLLLTIFIAAGLILGSLVGKMLRRGGPGARYARVLSRTVRLVFFGVGLVMGLQVLGLTALATSLLATGGLVAVILGFAFKEIGENLLAGLFLGVSRSFEIGDLIESSGHLGKVREINLRQVWIRSGDGRDIFIPSAQIFRNVLENYTRDGLRRGEFVIGLDYGADIDEACDLLNRTVQSVEHVLDQPAPSVMYSSFEPSYCALKIMLWTNTDDGPGLGPVRSKTMSACLNALKRAGFALSSDATTNVAIARDQAN